MSNTRYDNMSKAPNKSASRASKFAITPKEVGLNQKRSKYTNMPFTKSNGKPNLNVTSKKPVSLPKFNFKEDEEE